MSKMTDEEYNRMIDELSETLPGLDLDGGYTGYWRQIKEQNELQGYSDDLITLRSRYGYEP